MSSNRFTSHLIIFTTYLLALVFIPIGQVRAADPAQPPDQAMVISQVRGPECCDPGSLETLKYQVELFKKHYIPAYLTLRYDALVNEEFVKYLQTEIGEGIKLGLFLEITPKLAQASQVEYRGDDQTWYQAQNAYTIGLLPKDRTKIIDTLFQTFYQHFQYYPELTTAWITDTPTLNYIHDRYGVKVHELTREQWGTDSYTLWGGVEHYPYPASRQWALLPDFDQSEPLTIVRQTVSDPLLSYADESSSFTSQPNDYIRDGKDFVYFKDLITQTINQSDGQTGFLVVGLETSMDRQHHQEFSEQIEYLSQLQKEHKISFIEAAKLSTNWSQPVTLYSGSDLTQKSHNISHTINTPHYRIRLRQNNNHIFISDLRIFNVQFTDPYADYQAYHAGYWVVPDIIDGGRWYNQDQKKPILNRIFDPPEFTSSIFKSAKSDLESNPSRIELPEIKPNTQIDLKFNQEKDKIVASYQSKYNNEIKLIFTAQEIKISPPDTKMQYYSFKPSLDQTTDSQTELDLADGTEITWPNQENPLVRLKKTCSDQECTLNLTSQPKLLTEMRAKFYPFLFPERKPRAVSDQYSIIFAHNRYALANRNPVRLVVAPFDSLNFPTSLKTTPAITTEPAVDRISQPTVSPNSVATYFDLHQSQPAQIKVTVDLGDGLAKVETVYFAPDCSQNQPYCLRHPRQAWWYLRFKLWNWLREQLETS